MKSLSNIFILVTVILGFTTIFGFVVPPKNRPFINLIPPVEGDIICPQVNYDNQTTGKLQTPNFPAKYPNSADCKYLITVPMGKRVSVIFDIFETEECCDYINIYEGVNKNETNLLQRVSGDNTGLIVTTNATNIMEIRFVSDANRNFQGFHAVFDAVDDPGFVEYQCSSNFTDLSGVIVSPDFPFNYPPNANCSYLIGNGKPGTLVSLTINTFATEACCDHLKLYEGMDNTGTLIMDLPSMSGSQVPETTYNTTMSSYMYLEFKSDANGQDSGYSIKYEIVDPMHSSVTTGPSFHNVVFKH